MQQPYEHEIGHVLSEHRTLCNSIVRLGEPAVKCHGRAVVRLKERIADAGFEKLGLKERKNNWLKLCHWYVRILRADLKTLVDQEAAKGQAEPKHSLSTKRLRGRRWTLDARARALRRSKGVMESASGAPRAPRVRRIDEDRSMMEERTRQRMRRERAGTPYTNKTPPAMRLETTRRSTRRARRVLWPSLVRRTKSTADPDVAAAKLERLRDERGRAVTRREELREVRSSRMRRLRLQQDEWLRRRRHEESGQAGNDLWAELEGYMGGTATSSGRSAWPRISGRQGERLVEEVEAFVSGRP